MHSLNGLVKGEKDYVFAKENDTYLVYLLEGGTAWLDLSAATGEFEVLWFDPRNGGDLQKGSVTKVAGGESVSLGKAPADVKKDWAVLVKKI